MNVGDMAPEFSLPGTTGPGLDLAKIRGKERAALFFYPADRTSGWLMGANTLKRMRTFATKLWRWYTTASSRPR